MAAIKKYVLVESTRPTAPVFLQVSENEMIHQNTLKLARPYLQVEVVQDGIVKIARLKLAAKSIWQDEQIAAGIPANAQFTQQERDAVKFVHGELSTELDIVQKFLDNHPQNEGFKGDRQNYNVLFRSVDEKAQKKEKNDLFKRKLEAGNKIAKMELEDAQEMLLLINGTFFTVPDNLDEAQNLLIEFLDSSDEAADEILETEFTEEQKMNLTINKAIHKGILSYDKNVNQVSLKKQNKWVNVRTSDSTLEQEERQRQFVEYLLTDAGKALREELETATKKPEKKPEVVQ